MKNKDLKCLEIKEDLTKSFTHSRPAPDTTPPHERTKSANSSNCQVHARVRLSFDEFDVDINIDDVDGEIVFSKTINNLISNGFIPRVGDSFFGNYKDYDDNEQDFDETFRIIDIGFNFEENNGFIWIFVKEGR